MVHGLAGSAALTLLVLSTIPSTVLGFAYIAVFGLRGGDVNQSYPAIALVGMTWLLAAAALEGPIRGVADRHTVAHVSRVISSRAETPGPAVRPGRSPASPTTCWPPAGSASCTTTPTP